MAEKFIHNDFEVFSDVWSGRALLIFCRSAWPWKEDQASVFQKVNNDEAVAQLVPLWHVSAK